MPSIGDTVREGIQGMAAGREADQTVAGIGDTVAASPSLINLMQTGPPIVDTVDIFFLIAKVAIYR